MKCVTAFSVGVALLAFLTLSMPAKPVEGANILGIFTSHSPSHLIVHMSLMKALAERGHNITVVCSQKPKVTHKSINLIIIPPTAEQEAVMNTMMTAMTKKENNVINLFTMVFSSMTVMMEMQFNVLSDQRFTALYDAPDTKFDVVFVGFFFNDFQFGFGAKFGCPLIVDWPGGSNQMLDHYIGNPPELAYVPNMNIGVKPGGSMTFMQRVQNFAGSAVFSALTSVIGWYMQGYYGRLFPSENFPTYAESKMNVSLMFVNGHFSEGPIRPNVPALIEIGGIQIKAKPDPLPQDIADHLKAAKKHGAILFSLGSNVKSSNFKPETMNNIYRVLSKLKQNVIWKWEDLDKTPGNAPNILYKKWLPQDDILAHPNLRLFITHAGKGGLTESSYHGVPMVALPVFADQSGNAERMVASGYGRYAKMLTLTEDELREAVTDVLSNPIYKENVKRFAQLYRDRPLSAKELVVYWTEYVIRHKGAAHMQSPLVRMNAIQAGNWDVIAFIFGVLYVGFKLLKGLYCLVRGLVCKKCRSSSADKTKKQKQN